MVGLAGLSQLCWTDSIRVESDEFREVQSGLLGRKDQVGGAELVDPVRTWRVVEFCWIGLVGLVGLERLGQSGRSAQQISPARKLTNC